MDDFKKLTEQLLKIYINSESVNDLRIENYFDENISLIGTGQHEIYRNLHEFLKSFEFDVKRRGKIRIDIQNLHQEEEQLDDDHVLAHGTVDFIGLFKDGSICFKMATRFTIIYKWTNGKWLVQHLHHSTPDLEQMDGEEFPLTLGKQVKKTRQALHALGTVVQDYRRYFLQELRMIRLRWNTLFQMSMSALKIVSLCSNNRQKVKTRRSLWQNKSCIRMYIWMHRTCQKSVLIL